MDVAQIGPDETGGWLLLTATGDRYLLVLPPDGRARCTRSNRRPHRHTRRELVAWGGYHVLAGLRSGVAVGESLVLITEPLMADGTAVATLSSPVTRIRPLRHGSDPSLVRARR